MNRVTGLFNRKKAVAEPESPPVHQDYEAGNYEQGKQEYNYNGNGEEPLAVHTNDGTQLHRGLQARHITMIAIGGAIGTGLIIGTGSALANSGYVLFWVLLFVLRKFQVTDGFILDPARFLSHTRLLVSSSTWLCAHSARWPPGSRLVAVSLVTRHGSAIPLSALRLVTPTGLSTSSLHPTS